MAPARVRQAVEEALELGCSNVGAIRYLLNVDGLEQPPTADTGRYRGAEPL